MNLSKLKEGLLGLVRVAEQYKQEIAVEKIIEELKSIQITGTFLSDKDISALMSRTADPLVFTHFDAFTLTSNGLDVGVSNYFEIAKKVGTGIKQATGHKHLYFLCLGNLVKHAHIWILPHFAGDGHGTAVNWEAVKSQDEKEMETIAEKIKLQIGGAI